LDRSTEKNMKSVPVSTLQSGLKFAGDVYLDEGFILLTPEVIMSEELVERLKAWGYGEIYQGEGTAEPSVATEDGEVVPLAPSSDNPKELKEVVSFYHGLLEFTQKLFQLFIRRNQISVEPLTEQIKEIMQVVKTHKRYILRFNELDKGDFPYLTYHSANVAILVVALGEAMKVPTHKLIDLGIAGLLHEVGMLKLPEKLQNSKNPLSMDEKKALSAHPIIGFKALKALAFPPNVYVPVLQHHERMDGTGYPQGLKSDRIADFSKILAVASAYDAMLSSRPYRDARSGHASLLDLLKDIGRAHDEGVLANWSLSSASIPSAPR
jgi:HD-GYP domain-containing protein (c-di-GMP phosphodiesterase class II)